MKLKMIAAFIGLSEGIVVGNALVAFLTILDIVPRLAQLTNTEKNMKVYEAVIVLSATIISLGNFINISVSMGKMIVILAGLIMGIFVGLLASALTEVTNVIPVLINRFQLHNYIKYIFISLACGKVIGSLIYWMIINR